MYVTILKRMAKFGSIYGGDLMDTAGASCPWLMHQVQRCVLVLCQTECCLQVIRFLITPFVSGHDFLKQVRIRPPLLSATIISLHISNRAPPKLFGQMLQCTRKSSYLPTAGYMLPSHVAFYEATYIVKRSLKLTGTRRTGRAT